MKIKLHPKEDHPKESEPVFALSTSSGFVGMVMFYNGHWYRIPDMYKADNSDFQWIELTNEDS